ncbi:MAG TPA: ABC-F family ATP-binding cassette domain-containing protein [Brevundimonas sp.]|uniref:ABC-F family ATP-binding cassette domain-containing protein n=1 Tax=Brevundimonas sp. TaxID=1871086 RepID=UPI002DEF0D3F|nr:ABC-F family ATP-binding cassette domain-containing protein [Brevundimonas sp.]
MTLNGVAARTPDGRPLFEDLTLAFGRELTGVVGRNGAGKTTLLRLVAGLAEPVEGAVTRVGRVGWLPQRDEPRPHETVADLLGCADDLARIDRITAGQGDDDDLNDVDWTLEARLNAALADVGLAGLTPDRKADTLSGGERTRVRLAALLLDEPDLLVLDEPTNHLDAAGRAAIAGLLDRWTGGAVVVSHDRALLRGMDRIVELTSLGTRAFGGGWDLYVERRDAERAAAARGLESAERAVDAAAREAQRAVEKKARRDRVGRAFAASGSAPKIVLGMMAERAEKSGGGERRLAERKTAEAEAGLAEARDRVERVRTLSIPLPPTGLAAGRTVLEVTDATWDAPEGRRVLGPVSLRLTGPERVAITGANGVGKTTLLRLISGELTPTTGTVSRRVAGALLDQEVALLRPEETLLAAWRRLNPSGSPNAAQAALARFLFRNAAAQRVVGTLSGGERLRAALACVMTGATPPELLVLDEPTNHLDLEAIEAVESALTSYDGALVVVSHDRDFLDAVGVDREIAL